MLVVRFGKFSLVHEVGIQSLFEVKACLWSLYWDVLNPNAPLRQVFCAVIVWNQRFFFSDWSWWFYPHCIALSLQSSEPWSELVPCSTCVAHSSDCEHRHDAVWQCCGVDDVLIKLESRSVSHFPFKPQRMKDCFNFPFDQFKTNLHLAWNWLSSGLEPVLNQPRISLHLPLIWL